jgi:hypothetical protein
MGTMKRKLRVEQRLFIELLQSKFGSIVTRKQILEVAAAENAKKIGDFLIRMKSFRANWGHYNLADILTANQALLDAAAAKAAGNLPPPVVEESVKNADGIPL